MLHQNYSRGRQGTRGGYRWCYQWKCGSSPSRITPIHQSRLPPTGQHTIYSSSTGVTFTINKSFCKLYNNFLPVLFALLSELYKCTKHQINWATGSRYYTNRVKTRTTYKNTWKSCSRFRITHLDFLHGCRKM